MAKLVLENPESGEETETHALKLLEVLIFQGGAQVPGVIDHAVDLAYKRGYCSHDREIDNKDMANMCTMVILAGIYVDESNATIFWGGENLGD